MNPLTAHLDIADPRALVRRMIARGLVKPAPPLSDLEITRLLRNDIKRRHRQRRRRLVNFPPLTPRNQRPTQ